MQTKYDSYVHRSSLTSLIRKPTGLALIIIAILAVAISPLKPLPVHAAGQTGTVCIAPGVDTTGCPPVPVGIIDGTTAGPNCTVTTNCFTVNVNIQGSAFQLGFEIYVKTNPALIEAATNTTADVVLGPAVDSPLINTECINGHATSGACNPPLDGDGVVHLTVASSSGIPSSANGVLFSINYRVKSLATTTGSPIAYQTGCSSPTNPQSNDNQCVLIVSGSAIPHPENVNTGTWLGPLNSYLLGATPSVETIDISGVQTSTINATQYNSYAFKTTPVTLFTTVSNSTVTNRPTVTLSPTTISSVIPKTSYNTATLTIKVLSNTPAGVYFVSVNGTASGQPPRSATVIVTVPSPNFAVTSNPNIVNQLYVGATGSSTITLVSQNNFTGTVNLSAPPPTGLTLNLARTSLVLKGGGTNSTLLTGKSTTPNNYFVTVTATSGSITHTIQVQFKVVDYSTSASPNPVNVNQSSQNSTIITISALNAFAGAVNLTATSPAGITTHFNVTSVTGGAGISNLTIAANGAINPGTYSVTVTGSSISNGFNLVHQTAIAVNVLKSTLPTFDINATSPASVNVGIFANSTITVTERNSFSGTVNLSDAPPPAVNCKAISPTSVIVNPTTQTATATLSCTATVQGGYSVVVTGNSISPHTPAPPVYAFFNFTDFTVTVSSPSPFPANAGVSASSNVTIAGQNGFSGTVLLSSAPSTTGLTCTQPSPSSITLPSSTTTATFSCTSNSPGAFNATLTATHGVITHIVKAIGFNFTDFTISATTPTAVIATQTTTTTISIAPLNLFNSRVSLSDTPLPNGLSCNTISPQIINRTTTASLSCSASVGGNYIVTITGTNNTLIHQATATFSFTDFTIAATSPAPNNVGVLENSTITLNAVNGFTGTVNLSFNAAPGLSCQPISPPSVTFGTSPQTAKLSCTSTTNGTFRATVIGTISTLTHNATATFIFGKDFNITSQPPAPANVNVVTGATITLNAINGFTGTVNLSVNTAPGLSCQPISPPSVTFGTTPQTATLSCSSSTAGSYKATVTGTFGSLIHNTNVTFTITDFNLVASPASAPLNIQATSTITLAALVGFTGTVTLTDTVPSGLICNPINPSTITFGATPQTAALSCNSSVAAIYIVKINATSGGLIHTTTATFTIGTDFGIAASSPAGIAGQTVNSTITLTSINGFGGTVSIFATPPTGLICSLSTSSLTVSSTNPAATATLSCVPSAPGNYNVTITGTFSTLTHAAMAKFTITDFTIFLTTPSTVIVGKFANSTITITGQNGFSGTISLLANPDFGLTCNPISSSATLPPSFTTILSCNAANAGQYKVTITGSTTNGFGTAQRSKTITFNIIDFTITASAPVANPGVSSISAITLASNNGFVGAISLSDTVQSGLTCNAINPLTITFGATPQVATLSCNSASPGIFQVTITATNGTLTHTTIATFTYSDFTITASPPPTVAVGSTTSSTITISGLNQLTGTISLSASAASGITCSSVSPSSITITFGTGPQTATAMFSCSSSTAGTYTVNSIGTIGAFSHTAQITVTVADFSISITPSTALIVSQGGSNSTTIQLTNTGPVSENITLSAPVTPAGPGTSLTQKIVRLSPGQSASVTLTVTGGIATPGSYTVLANATLYSLVRSPAITVTIILPAINFVSLSTPSTTGQAGQTVSVTVDVSNPSKIALSFNLTLDVNNVSVALKPLTLQPGQDSGPILLTWDTTNYPAGNYTITVRLVGTTTTGSPPVSPQLAQTSKQAGTIQLAAAQQGANLPGGTTTLIAIILIVIEAIAVGTILFRRRGANPQTKTQP